MRSPFFLLILMLFVILFISCKGEKKVAPKSNNGWETSEITKMSGMVAIPSGTLNMGADNDQADRNEYPKHEVKIEGFWMDQTEVTNTQFEKFIKTSGYVTVAERPIIWEDLLKQLPPGTPRLPDSLLQPGALVFHASEQPVSLNNPSLWWRWTIGANWRHPEGPASNIQNKMDHPVVQIAWEDAKAYANWCGKRLPTEAEWEWASRGGIKNAIYPWGSENVNEGAPKANFWQGLFPYENEKKDGYITTAPVKTYPPNLYGLYDMAGNVWEWCGDWFDHEYYAKETATSSNTKGPKKGYNPQMTFQQEKIIRGGSFLCNDGYCSGYRNARRMGSSVDTGLNHTGFRCVKTN